MVMAGLLWYDDDAKRPLAAKIIEATERYRDRIGFAPTVCQLPPQQLKALTEASTSPRKRARTPVIELPRKLRLEPDERLHPNTFLLGMGEDDIAIPNPLLAESDETPRRARQMKHPRPAKTPPKTAAPATPPVALATIRARTAKATAPVKRDVTTAPAIKPKVARAAKAVAAEKVAEPVSAAHPAASTVKWSAKRSAKRSAAAKQVQRVEAKQATLWDTAPAKATRARATAKPAISPGKKFEKVARTAKPHQLEAGNLSKPTKPAMPNKAARVAEATKAAQSSMPPARRADPSAAKQATRSSRPPAAKPTQPAKAIKAAKPVQAEQRAKPAATGSTKATGRVTEKTARPARPVANERTRTVRSLEKQAARATITPAAPAKPKATRKPTVEKSVTVARPTPVAPKSATPRRRLAKSA